MGWPIFCALLIILQFTASAYTVLYMTVLLILWASDVVTVLCNILWRYGKGALSFPCSCSDYPSLNLVALTFQLVSNRSSI